MGQDDSEVVSAAQRDDERSAADLIDALEAGPQLLRYAIEDMTADQLQAHPVAGAMSTIEVLGHVADCEQFLADRIKRTAATERPLLVGVDGRCYLEALHYSERDVETQLQLVELTRRQLAADLRRLDPDAWSRTAVHTETGLVTLRQLVLHTVRHLERHVDAIRAKRSALGLD
jgi:hypothetical protein